MPAQRWSRATINTRHDPASASAFGEAFGFNYNPPLVIAANTAPTLTLSGNITSALFGLQGYVGP